MSVQVSLWDILTQAGILLSVVGYLILAKKNKWGWVIGLASQPFWFYASITNHQIAIVINTVFFSITQLYGIWKWFGPGARVVHSEVPAEVENLCRQLPEEYRQVGWRLFECGRLK